jgi:hypothetical protein
MHRVRPNSSIKSMTAVRDAEMKSGRRAMHSLQGRMDFGATQCSLCVRGNSA